jgi:hypothetical protein
MKPYNNDDDDADLQALVAAAELQQKSKDVLVRLQQNLETTQQVGGMTLDDLHAQRLQLENMERQGDRLHEKLDETEYLQSKLGSWFGGKRKQTNKNKNKNKKVVTNPASSESLPLPKNPRWILGRSSKKQSVASHDHEEPTAVRIGSLEKDAVLYKGEHRDKMKALATGDQEIDAHMDFIGDQLGSLLTMAQEIGTETKLHGQRIGTVDKLISDAQVRQEKVNKKASRLIR